MNEHRNGTPPKLRTKALSRHRKSTDRQGPDRHRSGSQASAHFPRWIRVLVRNSTGSPFWAELRPADRRRSRGLESHPIGHGRPGTSCPLTVISSVARTTTVGPFNLQQRTFSRLSYNLCQSGNGCALTRPRPGTEEFQPIHQRGCANGNRRISRDCRQGRYRASLWRRDRS